MIVINFLFRVCFFVKFGKTKNLPNKAPWENESPLYIHAPKERGVVLGRFHPQ